MFSVRKSLAVALLVATTAVTTSPAFAEGDKPKPQPGHAAKAKPACTADELAAFVAARKAEKAKHEHDKKPEASTSPESDRQVVANEPKRDAKKSGKAAEELARACAAVKAARAEQAKHEAEQKAEQKARARKFQAIGVVATQDAAAGTITVFVKAGSPDLHSRRLAIVLKADTVIQLDGEKATAAQLISGTFVSVHGVRGDGTLTAARINAASADVDGHDGDEAPSPSATATAAPVAPTHD